MLGVCAKLWPYGPAISGRRSSAIRYSTFLERRGAGPGAGVGGAGVGAMTPDWHCARVWLSLVSMLRRIQRPARASAIQLLHAAVCWHSEQQLSTLTSTDSQDYVSTVTLRAGDNVVAFIVAMSAVK